MGKNVKNDIKIRIPILERESPQPTKQYQNYEYSISITK